MIQEFVKVWDEFKGEVEETFRSEHPGYKSLVTAVVTMLNKHLDEYSSPDPSRITVIDYGDYQGTMLFVIAGSGYQPSDFWHVTMSYGSCSFCDTMQSIQYDGEYGEDKPNDKQVADYMTLALHVIQRLKKLEE